ncbi:MAG: DUF2391 family protein [Parcubacteria group bacterium]|nr:DUF2391 family protein [Parcubacteria group bacterium]
MPKAKQKSNTASSLNLSAVTGAVADVTGAVAGTIKDVATLPLDVARAVGDEVQDILRRATNPLRTEFLLKDLLQVVIGATILAVPVGLSEESWRLANELPASRIATLAAISIIFIGTFVYYNYYRGTFTEHWDEYVKRVLSTYFFSLLVVAGLLSLIEVGPWPMDLVLTLKRTIIVAFPASMSAVVADTIK